MLRVEFLMFPLLLFIPAWLTVVHCQLTVSEIISSSSYFPTVETISIAFVLPSRNLTPFHIRGELRNYFASPQHDASRSVVYRLQVNPVYATKTAINETAKEIFCSAASDGINAVFLLVDKAIQGDAGTQMANLVTMLANAAGMPTLAWSSSSFELEADISLTSMPRFLLAPSIRSQARALYAFLQTHTWKKFSLIESHQTAGHEIFVDEMHKLAEREYKDSSQNTRTASFVHEQHYFGSRLMRVVKLAANWRDSLRTKLVNIRDNDKTRFIVVYSNEEEAIEIFNEARTLGMTSADYSWVCAKPVLGDDDLAGSALHFVPGTVVVTYDTSYSAQLEVVKAVANIWSTAVRKLTQMPFRDSTRLSPNRICDDHLHPQWRFKDAFIDFIRQSKIANKSAVLEFDENWTMEITRVILLNLDAKRQWSKFGDWTHQRGLHLNAPEFSHELENDIDADIAVLKVVTLQEPPYIMYEPMNPVTNTCPRTAIPCQLSPLVHLKHTTSDGQEIKGHNANDSWVCCVGLCVDLLRRLSDDLGFRYYMYEVTDRKWGSTHNVDGQWNGLVKALMRGEADMAMTSLKINKERSEAIDFSVPYLETGITMMVSVKEVGTSATAFLEPFSMDTWFAILVGLINICAFSMFFFEYIGNCLLAKNWRTIRCSFSPFSSLWLSWAMLFKAVVKVELPKNVGARLMTCIWGMFCVIFASSYMANLAVFMITKEDFHDFSGLDDPRIKNPYSKIPPYRFATIAHGATETFLRQNYGRTWEYMRLYNKTTVEEGVQGVKRGLLDAFIYDAKVLEYLAGRDKECRLKIVGKWYSTTGYAIGFPQSSKWISMIDKKIIDYQHNGFIQQLIEFWLTGDCQRHKKQEQQKSYQLGVMNFTSAFVLLFFGICVCFVLLIFEHLYYRYLSRYFSRRGAYLWDRLLNVLNVPFIVPPPNNSNDKNSNPMTPTICRPCANCGGADHWTSNCPSPRLRQSQVHLETYSLTPSPKRNHPEFRCTSL